MNTASARRRRRKRNRGPQHYFHMLLSLLLICAVAMSLYQFVGSATGKAAPMYRTIKDDEDDVNITDDEASSSTPPNEQQTNYTSYSGDIHSGYLTVVNSNYACKFPDEDNLVSIFERQTSHYFVGGVNLLVDPTIMEPLNDMMEDFYSVTGNDTLNIVSSYRTQQEQQELYDESLAEHGQEHTTQFQAVPGYSEHHTGLVIDLGIYFKEDGTTEWFDGTGDTKWILDNSWEYGFVQRYETSKQDITGIANEPWHFRYVGLPHSCYMYEHDLCLEEYIDLLRSYPYNGQHLTFDCKGDTYEVYYCAGDSYYVPEGVTNFSVSGNNIDGFIISMQLSTPNTSSATQN